jgi:metal-sulfur cluster biosynthetic enzyme
MNLVSKELVMEKLNDVFDPELQMSIVELGLVYDVEISGDSVKVTYTLTTPGCPIGPIIDSQIQDAVMGIPGVRYVDPVLTFSPPWDPRTMASDDVKMAMGIW